MVSIPSQHQDLRIGKALAWASDDRTMLVFGCKAVENQRKRAGFPFWTLSLEQTL
jgi:hypothetical protein